MFDRQRHEYPLSRSLLVGLCAVFVVVISMHFSRLSLWMLVVAAGVLIWRVNRLRQRWPLPGKWLNVVIMLLAIGGLTLQHRQWLSVEPMIDLLLMALVFKLLELHQRRDMLVVLFLSYFAIACSFLFQQSVLHTLHGAIAVVTVTTVLLQLNSQLPLRRLLRLSMLLCAQSVVLAVVMMLVLPRLNPLWSVPLHSGQAIVGVSDSMSPGDFDQLIRSNELAMRITFDDKPLPRGQMYWRGLVFDQFDGRRWQRSVPVDITAARLQGNSLINSTISSPNPSQPNPLLVELSSSLEDIDYIDYEVLLEPTGQHWLYGVPALSIERINAATAFSPQQEVFYQHKVQQRIKYAARSYLLPALPLGLSPDERRRYTALPQGVIRKHLSAPSSGGSKWRVIKLIFSVCCSITGTILLIHCRLLS